MEGIHFIWNLEPESSALRLPTGDMEMFEKLRTADKNKMNVAEKSQQSPPPKSDKHFQQHPTPHRLMSFSETARLRSDDESSAQPPIFISFSSA